MLLLEHHLQFGGVLVADGQPERAVGLEHADDLGRPLAAPVEVVLALQPVVVDVVVVADVERRIGERQVDHAVAELLQPGDAVLVVEHVELFRQGSVSLQGKVSP